jgi:peptidoglycan/LPS O-acetylase OafA/YrhL
LLSVVGLALDKFNKQIFSFLALGLIFGGATYLSLVDRSLLTRPLHAKIFYPISRLSYGMYLNHFLVVPKSTEWVIRHGAGLPTFAVFFAGLLLGTLISIAVATLTFLLIEHPFLQLRATLLATRARPIIAPEQAVLAGARDAGHRSAWSDRAS